MYARMYTRSIRRGAALCGTAYAPQVRTRALLRGLLIVSGLLRLCTAVYEGIDCTA